MMTMLKTCILNRESSECSECLHQAGDVQCPPGDDDKDEAGGDIDDNCDMTVMTKMKVVLTLMTAVIMKTTTITRFQGWNCNSNKKTDKTTTAEMTTERKITRFMAGRPAAWSWSISAPSSCPLLEKDKIIILIISSCPFLERKKNYYFDYLNLSTSRKKVIIFHLCYLDHSSPIITYFSGPQSTLEVQKKLGFSYKGWKCVQSERNISDNWKK